MRTVDTKLPGVVIIEPDVYRDERGYFMESWNAARYRELGIDVDFVQDNHSRSSRWTLRGLHYQLNRPQGKLVRATVGTVFDVAVDLRRDSPHFGEWVGVELSAENHRQLWIPPGFAHGFLVLSEVAEFQYKCTTFYDRDSDRSLLWSEPSVGIAWPLPDGVEPLLSPKDRAGGTLATSEACTF
ncbi:MAG: dTDP-4-dehydrorhamnose 3,5-epimerase [Pseudomonadales bacterium]|jgi:dTDP-4-dehydrorhamnose 3,5-epimerase|nr:dTDP-4-dehydrorhamnose 3,5-epimerase [Pseudomonadales bacterium]